MKISTSEKDIVRLLASSFMERLDMSARAERIAKWKAINSLRDSSPPIYLRAFAWDTLPESRCESVHPVCRELEYFFKRQLFHMGFDDDYIFQPFYQSSPIYPSVGWGLHGTKKYAGSIDELESYKEDNPLKSYDDIKKLVAPHYETDEKLTAEKEEILNDLIGHIMPVEMYRGPWCWGWGGDIACAMGHLRGIENIMMDVYEEPEGLSSLARFLSENIVRMNNEAEISGELTLMSHFNQAMPYSDELPAPECNVKNVKLKQLWGFAAAQEFTLIGPEHHDEFLLRYQMPVMEQYGLIAYGCCEDLTRKIPMLRQIPNLRRISVSPFADVSGCVEQIGCDYTISYRPNPALLASGYNPETLYGQLKKDLNTLKNSIFDITLKDVETIECEPGRIKKFVSICRELIS